jgi:hypothetical protein
VFAQTLTYSKGAINLEQYCINPQLFKGFALCSWLLNFISTLNKVTGSFGNHISGAFFKEMPACSDGGDIVAKRVFLAVVESLFHFNMRHKINIQEQVRSLQ